VKKLASAVYHCYPSPKSDKGNGVARYGSYLDKLLPDIYTQSKSAKIWHIELGYTGVHEFWQAVACARTGQAYMLTLHDPPVVVGKPFERYLPGTGKPTKVLRKLLDITIGRLLIRWVVSRARAVIVLNRQATQLLGSSKSFYLPLPILVDSAPAKRSAQEVARLLFFGNVSHRKGVDVLIRALSSVPNSAQLELTIAGQPDQDLRYQSKLKDLIQRSGLNVALPGYVSEARLSQLVQLSDIVVLPYRRASIVHASGPLLGSMAQGKPIIASDIPTFSDVVRSRENGWLFPEGDVKALALALETLITDTKLRESLGRHAKAFTRKYHNDTVIARDLMRIYEEIV